MVTPQYKKTKDWALSSDWTRAPRKGRQFLHLSFKFRRMIGATKQIYIFVLQFTCLPKTWCFRCQRDSNLLQTRVFVTGNEKIERGRSHATDRVFITYISSSLSLSLVLNFDFFFLIPVHVYKMLWCYTWIWIYF